MPSGYFSIMGNLDWIMPHILPFLPKYKHSVEVCCGRLELGWWTPPPAGREIKNDKDAEIIRLHRFVQRMSWEEICYFATHYNWWMSKPLFNSLRFVHKRPDSDFDFAYRMLYLLGSGKRHSYYFRDTFMLGKEGRELSTVRRLELRWRRLRHMIFTNLDGVDAIRQFDSPDTFFFLDPPYPSRERYYPVHDLDWKKIYDILHTVQGKWMIVVDPSISGYVKRMMGESPFKVGMSRQAHFDYVMKSRRYILKLAKEFSHFIFYQPYLLGHVWTKTPFPDYKTYYCIWNYEIPNVVEKYRVLKRSFV